MIKSIEGIESQLSDARQTLRDRLQAIDAERSEIIEELSRVEDCLTALTGRKPKAKPRKAASTSKACATKDEVLKSATQLLSDNGGAMPKDDLVLLIQDRLKANGKSLSGFGLIFNRLCKDVLQVDGQGVVVLATKIQDSNTGKVEK